MNQTSRFCITGTVRSSSSSKRQKTGQKPRRSTFRRLGIGYAWLFVEQQRSMNATNPFQVPSCLQRAHLQERRQNRFKRIVVGSVVATTALLVFLLVEGCMSEHAKSAAAAKDPVAATPDAAPVQVAEVTAPKPVVIPQPKPVAPPAPVAASPLRDAKSRVLSGSETFYVVKSGDTLARIAKVHRVPVKTLMAANNLNDDKLVVGTKLKLPTV
jgi:LysM repeat protein